MIAIIILSIIVILLSYFIYKITNKYDRLYNTSKTMAQWIDEFNIRVNYIDDKLKEIDRRGSFEADDETGFVFTEIKQLIALLTEINKLVVKEDSTQ